MSQPTSAPVEIYLGKNGETFGPYTLEQFEAIKTSPDYATYTYIWDGRQPGADWKPIERAPVPPPPPRKQGPGAPPPDTSARTITPPSAPAAAAAVPVASATPAVAQAPAPEPMADVIPISRARKAPALRGYDVPWIEALCHDARSVVSGKLTQVTDAGCELICGRSATPPNFGAQSHVRINLLDPKNGQAMTVAARLDGVKRHEGQWSLKVLWDECPELIVRQLEKAA
jgi:hypothetical protein